MLYRIIQVSIGEWCATTKFLEAPPSLVILIATRKCLCEVHTACAAYAQHMRTICAACLFFKPFHLRTINPPGKRQLCLVDNGSILWWQHPKGDKTCEVWCQMWQHVCDDFGKRSLRCTAHLRYSLPEGSDWMARLSNLLASVLDTYIKKTKHRT